MPPLSDPVIEGLAQLGITATAIAGPDEPLALWLVTDWSSLDPAALAMLSPAEHARAARFASARLRDRYRAAHVALRCVMECRLGVPAAAQRYRLGRHGKPHLIGDPAASFSLSYSADRLLIGTAAYGVLGVDIEAVRPIEDAAVLAAHYYTAEERALLAAHAPDAEAFDRSFLSIWTRKEACVKALGSGLGEIVLSSVACGAAGVRAVRVGDRQLRTDTTLVNACYLISWAWTVSVVANVRPPITPDADRD